MGMMMTYRPGYWGDAPAAPDESTVVDKPLSKRNLVELQATAESLGIDASGSKADLRDRIRERQESDAVTAKPGDGQPGEDEDETPEGEQPDPENDPADAEGGEGDDTQPDPENDPDDAPEGDDTEADTEGE